MHESEKWKWSRSVVPDSQRPHGLQPTRLLCPWTFQARALEWGAIAFSGRKLEAGSNGSSLVGGGGGEVTTHTQAPLTRLIRASTDRQNRQPPLPNKQQLSEFKILPDKLGARSDQATFRCVAVYLKGVHGRERCGIDRIAGAPAEDNASEERYHQRRRGALKAGQESWSPLTWAEQVITLCSGEGGEGGSTTRYRCKCISSTQGTKTRRVSHSLQEKLKVRVLPGASLVAQRVKCLPAMWETWVWSPGLEDPLEKEMATHSSILAWKMPWTAEPGRLQSMATSLLPGRNQPAVRHSWFWLPALRRSRRVTAARKQSLWASWVSCLQQD